MSTAAPTLRQGKFFDEAEGAAELAANAATYSDLAGWQQRADLVRQGILDGMGLRHWPTLAPLSLIRHSRRALGEYAVENVAFPSLPGVYVTGNLYEPLKDSNERRAAILCTHGHAPRNDARFGEQLQKRCATLARMGATVLAIDMIGYADSTQCQHRLPAAAKLQLINCMRAIDVLLSLPQTDPERVAVTGESGGGTQAFLLAALDPRIKVSVPVAMVSCHFFGGCPCESGLPIHVRPTHTTCNAEIAALAAPRPQLLVSDGGDWTKNTPAVEFPYLQRIYGFYDSAIHVENTHFADEGHDYGPNKRQAAYDFLARHLSLKTEIRGPDGRFDESANQMLTPEQLAVFTDDFPRPADAVIGDERVTELVNAAGT